MDIFSSGSKDEALRKPLLGAAAGNSGSKSVKEPAAQGNDAFLVEGSLASSVVLLISAAVGTGVLALPYGVKLVGVFPAVMLFAIAGAAGFVSNVILFQCVAKTGRGSYGELMTAILGKRGAVVLDTLICLEGLGAVSTYCVFIMDYGPKVCELVAGSEAWCTDPHNVLKAAVVVIWPLSCFKGLSALRYVSTCSIMSITFTLLVVISKAPRLVAANEEPLMELATDVHLNPSNVLQVLSMACFAFMVHTNTPDIAASMSAPSRSRMLQANATQTAFIWFVFSAIGVSGFLSFGDDTAQDFLVNYSVTDVFATMCRAFLTITLVFACPINIFPGVQAFFNIWELLRSPAARARGKLYSSDALRTCVATVSLAISVVVALKTPRVADLITMVSSFFSAPLMFGFPAIMYWRILKGSNIAMPVAMITLTLLFWAAEITHLLRPAAPAV